MFMYAPNLIYKDDKGDQGEQKGTSKYRDTTLNQAAYIEKPRYIMY